MSNLDISKLTTNVLAQQQSEKRITEYKIFYKTHLQTIKQKKESLNELYPLCLKFQKIEPKTVFYQDKEILLLEIETKEIINKYFSPDILKLYEKEIPQPIKKNKIDFDKSFWQGLLESFSNTYVTLNEKIKQEWNYKTNFLVFLYNCLNQFGLHPDILRREANTYKRYNLVLEHYFKSKNKTSEHKILLTPDILQKDFLALY